jgi:hypothetical protein
MKKFFLLIFILIDLAVLSGACALIYNRLMESHAPLTVASLVPNMHPAPSTTPVPTALHASTSPITAPAGQPSAPATTPASAISGSNSIEPATRNIKFSYRNSKAKQVSIRADFTGWKAQTMTRDSGGVWSFQAALPPGEYAYCFTVDGRAIRDMANKRTKVIGQTTVSAVVVNPLAGHPEH